MAKIPRLVAVMGPTGSGKSGLAESISEQLGGVLVNADAFQVYRGFDIGTNKPSDRARYSLLDVCDPVDQFGVGEWLRRVEPVLSRAWEAGSDVVIVGGTGLYIRALFEGYSDMSGPPDPELRDELMRRETDEGLGSLVAQLLEVDAGAAERVDLKNGVRVRRALEKLLGGSERVIVEVPGFLKLKFGLEVNLELHRDLLSARLEEMVERGWVGEVRGLLESGVPEDSPAMRAIGYHTWNRYLSGAATFDESMAEVLTLTVQYAKRQRTWMRKEPGLRSIEVDPRSVGESGRVLASICTSISDSSG